MSLAMMTTTPTVLLKDDFRQGLDLTRTWSILMGSTPRTSLRPGQLRASSGKCTTCFFANQNALDDTSLVKYAADLALHAERVGRELESHEPAGRVAEDRRSALASGVRGTPNLYIDG